MRELAVRAGHPWRPVCLFLTRYFQKEAERLNQQREKPITHVNFGLGAAHPAYDALHGELGELRKPYAWYIRVPDLPGFLRHITPVLDKRLHDSIFAGHSGRLRLNFYLSRVALLFENGRLVQVQDGYDHQRLEEGDVRFPDLTFLQLLFGRRSFAELDDAFADCYASSAAVAALLDVLFPKRPSLVIGLG